MVNEIHSAYKIIINFESVAGSVIQATRLVKFLRMAGEQQSSVEVGGALVATTPMLGSIPYPLGVIWVGSWVGVVDDIMSPF